MQGDLEGLHFPNKGGLKSYISYSLQLYGKSIPLTFPPTQGNLGGLILLSLSPIHQREQHLGYSKT